MIDVADKLREARALVKRGWCSGAWRRGNRVCASTALRMAVGEGNRTAYREARKPFLEATGTYNIIAFNDAPNRTKKEVIAAFDKAIELAEAGQ